MEAISFVVMVTASFLVYSTADIIMSDEIKVQLEPPETTPTVDAPHPIILSAPGQLKVREGDSVVLPCQVDHLRSRVVFWKKGRTRTLFAGLLRVDQDRKFSLTDRTFLQIEKVTPEYAGEYICQVNTQPPLELIHTLNVLVSPSVTLEPKDGYVTVKEGDPIFAKCIANGHPMPVITWKALIGLLPGNIREKQGSVLSIPVSDIKHTGSYECHADNGVGNPAVALLKIKVFYSPELRIHPLWAQGGRGSTAEFECRASSEPPPSLYWTKGSPDPLVANRHIKLYQKSTMSEEILLLKIQNMAVEDLGTYSCFANNSVGSAFRTVEISGLAEPVRFKSNSTADDEDSFLLVWSVKSYSPIIEYMLRVRPQKSKESSSQATQWIDVMIPVDSEQSVFHTHKYNITGLEPGTGYEVVMQARNKYGWNHPSETYTFYTRGEELSDGWDKTTTVMTSPFGSITESPLHYTELENVVNVANRILPLIVMPICLCLHWMFV